MILEVIFQVLKLFPSYECKNKCKSEISVLLLVKVQTF